MRLSSYVFCPEYGFYIAHLVRRRRRCMEWEFKEFKAKEIYLQIFFLPASGFICLAR